MSGFSTTTVIPSTNASAPRSRRSGPSIGLLVALCACWPGPGCSTPYGDDPDKADQLQAVIEAAIAREAGSLEQAALEAAPESSTALDPDSEVGRALAARRQELDALGPQAPFAAPPLDLGPDLLDQPQAEVALGLREAVSAALEHNLATESARLGRAITDQDLVRAEAVFDAVFFSNFEFARIDQPQVVPFSNGFSLGISSRSSRDWGITTGLRNLLESGGVVEVSTSLGENDIAGTEDFTFQPDPAWSSAVTLGLTQPLLRGFGSEVTLSEVRLARNAGRASTEALRGRLMDTITQVETGYWNLVLARQRLVAAQWLVEVGIRVREVLGRRRGLDVTDANYADAVATVERRKADLILARRTVRAASDRLKSLVNAPDLPVGDETMIVPSDWMTDLPTSWDLREAITTAIEQAPGVRQALLEIDDASIGMDVADNGRLPQLDLQGQVRWNGLDDGPSASYGDLGSGGYIDYLVGLQFEQAIGNRAADAVYRQARLRRSAAVVGYRRAVQLAVLEVKSALRDVRSNHLLITQYQGLRLAQAENLRALQIDEELKAGLTPEFLALKFERQDGLALAQVREVQALVDYNIAIARLYRAMGIGLRMNDIEIRIEDTSAPLESASSRVPVTDP